MQGEMLEFAGHTYGLALNLERDYVGAVVLGRTDHFSGRASCQMYRRIFWSASRRSSPRTSC